MSGSVCLSRCLLGRLAISPGKTFLSRGAGERMFGGTGRLRKYLSEGGGLLSPTGGVASSASFFKSQHMMVHHKETTCKCGMSTSTTSSHGGREIEPDLKVKLEEWKGRLAGNVYFQKYKEKFAQMEMTSPKELLEKLERLDGRSAKSKTDSKEPSKPKAFSLRDVMEVNMLKDLNREDIVYLWQDFHRKKDAVVSAVMSGPVFDQMEKLASSHSVFVMPMPRTDGYEFFLVQYMEKTFHFTPLLVYQTHKENAPEVLRLINYTDLQDSKDLVLMRGEFDPKVMTIKDAHIMAVQINFYYGEISESRKQLLHTFTSSPDSFDHMKLIDELKSLQESHPHLFDFENSSSSSPSSSRPSTPTPP